MCCVKDEEPKSEKKSIFLGLLPVTFPLEERKQDTVFQMMGAEKQIRKQTATRARKFATYIPDPAEERYCSSFVKKVRVLGSKKKETTQEMRADAIEEINKLIKEAIDHGKRPKLSPMARVRWFRVVGYLFQVQRSIMKEYDAKQIRQELDHLKKVVSDELRKAKAERDKKHS